MITRVLSFLVVLTLVVFASGCSESPKAQYDAGQAALEQARLAEAEQYTPELFNEAADSLNAAMAEIQKQDGKFSVLRSYGKAKEIIAVSQRLAEKANSEAAVEKERVRVADSTLITEIEMLMSETKSILATAPKGKGSRVDLKVMQADLNAASEALVASTMEFNEGGYLTAQDKLLVIKSQVEKVKSEIQAAVAGLKKK